MGIYTILADDGRKGILIVDKHPVSGVPHAHEDNGTYFCPNHQFTILTGKNLTCPICKYKVIGKEFKEDKEKETFFLKMAARKEEFAKWEAAKAKESKKAPDTQE